MTTRARGDACAICSATAKPSASGSITSSRTRSGSSSRAAVDGRGAVVRLADDASARRPPAAAGRGGGSSRGHRRSGRSAPRCRSSHQTTGARLRVFIDLQAIWVIPSMRARRALRSFAITPHPSPRSDPHADLPPLRARRAGDARARPRRERHAAGPALAGRPRRGRRRARADACRTSRDCAPRTRTPPASPARRRRRSTTRPTASRRTLHRAVQPTADDSSPWPAIGLGLGLIVLVAGAVAIAVRTRRHTRVRVAA